MKKIVLGRTNTEVSAISLGTWAFGGANMNGKFAVGWGGQKDSESRSALLSAWKNGINHWDTADVYGDGKSEKILGNMWDTIPRKEIFLATKVGWDKKPGSYWYEPKYMVNNLERSLDNLKTNYVDLVYLHHCNFGKNGEYFNGALEVINNFKKQGKTRFIGLSDWSSVNILKYINRCNPDVIQPYRNVMDNNYVNSGLCSYVNQNNIGVCFFSPIKHGLLTGKYDKPTRFDHGDHRSNIKEFTNQVIIDKMKQNKTLLEERFSYHKNPVMHGIIDALFNDSSTACVLLGQRNAKQVDIAASLGKNMTNKDSQWVKSLYK
ncbi:MAG: aldo/keto reductase [Candidatus Neomarinimicrobiota bacterium]